MSTAVRGPDDEVQVYKPHRAGLPPLRPYFRDLWARRQFASELSRATMRAANSNTFFGRLWLVINPLLLAAVYYVLIVIISGGAGLDRLLNLIAGLFLFYFVSSAMTTGAASVTSSGKLVSTTAFPRLLMPLSAVRTAFYRFLPALIVYFPIHIAAGGPWSFTMLLSVVFLAYAVVFAAGLASLFAVLQVYFRDTGSFLPYFARLWLYLSPVLWLESDVAERFGATVARFAQVNPLYSMIGGWTDLLVRSEVPPPAFWIAGLLWSLVALLLGSTLFMSRERDFSVRL